MTGSIVLTKLLTLLCFTHMGMMSVGMAMEAPMPCHEEVYVGQNSTTECDACELALEAWSTSYVETYDIEIPDAVFSPIHDFAITEFTATLTATFKHVYRPPPQVIWVNAFHQPQLSTVLIV